MFTHWKSLEKLIPGLAQKDILDLGSGKGGFLIEVARQGGKAKGVECYDLYIEESYRRAKEAKVSIEVVQGFAENIPYPEASFDFVNLGEVIEHVDEPGTMLAEVHRVLRAGGKAYMSVPNRFGMRDPHFKLYFVNWLPRSMANSFISIFGTHKDYSYTAAGLQSLRDMHYYTYRQIHAFLRENHFSAIDIREYRIKNEYAGIKYLLAMLVYPIVRFWYYDSAHVLMTRNP